MDIKWHRVRLDYLDYLNDLGFPRAWVAAPILASRLAAKGFMRPSWSGMDVNPSAHPSAIRKKKQQTRLLNSKNRTWQNFLGVLVGAPSSWNPFWPIQGLSLQQHSCSPHKSPSGIPTTHLTAQGEALGMNFQIMQMDLVALVQNQGVVMFVAFVCWQEPETRAGSQRINDGAQPQRIKSILVREKKTQLTCLQCKALWNHFRYR